MKFYFHCNTPKDDLHIKISADSEEEATRKLLEMSNITEIISVNHNPPTVKYETEGTYYPFKRNYYPYIKNSNGKPIRIYG